MSTNARGNIWQKLEIPVYGLGLILILKVFSIVLKKQ